MGTDTSKAKLTQCDKILMYLNDYGSITQLDALREFGCMRLASRVSQINKNGDFRIRKELEEGKNRYGDKIHYARYFLDN